MPKNHKQVNDELQYILQKRFVRGKAIFKVLSIKSNLTAKLLSE